MSVDYTPNLKLGKPTVLNSLNVWGDELNDIMDILDFSIISNNFGEDETSHSGLDFGYFGGRILNNTTMVEVLASTVTLTNNQTNYIEVNLSGTVSANTTGFTAGQIPLFQVVTSAGSISSVTDKRAYMMPSHQSISSLTNSIINVDSDGNILFNAASAETSSEKALSLKQGVDPTTSTADQISIFGTAGSNCTLGLRTEEAITNDKLRVNINGVNKYLHCLESTLNPLSEFLTSDITVTNTIVETEIMNITIPARNPAGGQLLLLHMNGLVSEQAGDTLTLTIYMNTDTFAIYSTSGALTNSDFDLRAQIFIKDNANYNIAVGECYFGGTYYLGNYNYAEDFTLDAVFKVTVQWDNANVANIFTAKSGCIEIKN